MKYEQETKHAPVPFDFKLRPIFLLAFLRTCVFETQGKMIESTYHKLRWLRVVCNIQHASLLDIYI